MKNYIIFILLLISPNIFSQNSYVVFLKDKSGSTFNPFSYFDAKAIERRMILNKPLFDSTDFPISENYLNEIENTNIRITGCTRWFNAVFVNTNEKQIAEIKKLPYVKNVEE